MNWFRTLISLAILSLFMASCGGTLTRPGEGIEDDDGDTIHTNDDTLDDDTTIKDDTDKPIYPDKDSGDDPYCGNGFVDPGEKCDKENISCAELDKKFTGGRARCLSDCSGWDMDRCQVETDDSDKMKPDDVVRPDEDNTTPDEDNTTPDEDNTTPDEDNVIPDEDIPPLPDEDLPLVDEDFTTPDIDTPPLPDDDAFPTPITDTIGNTSQTGTSNEATFKGNYFTVNSNTTITEFKFYLQAPTLGTLYFYVYESDNQDSGYSRIFSRSVTVGTSVDFYGPSEMNLSLSSGKHYIFSYRTTSPGYLYYYAYTKRYPTAFGESEGTENFEAPNPPGTTNSNINGPGYTPASYYMTITSE